MSWQRGQKEGTLRLELRSCFQRAYIGAKAFFEDVEEGRKNLWELPQELQEEPEFVLAAVHTTGCSLEFASESLRSSKDVVLEAVRKNSWSLQFAIEALCNDKDVVPEAEENNEHSKFTMIFLFTNKCVLQS